MDMKVQKSRKYIAKKLGVLAMAAVITGGSFCQPVFAAKTITSAKTENAVQKHNKVAADPTQGELPDKDGKPSGVKWAIRYCNRRTFYHGEWCAVSGIRYG